MQKEIKPSDFLWNFGSVGVLVLGGFLLTTTIAAIYIPEVLGAFNEAYAYYLVISQIATIGINTAVLKFIAENCEDRQKKKEILGTGLILGILFSIAVSFVIFTVLFLLVNDRIFLNSMMYIIAALPMFTCNKIIMGFFNGNKNMKAFAVMQAGRMVFLILYLIVFVVFEFPPYSLTSIFLFAEISVLLFAILYLLYKKNFFLKFEKKLAHEIFMFGIQISPGNIVAGFNTKIDIICLGLITNDDFIVGIYSFATLFAEGMYQMYMIIRKLINPYLTEDFYRHNDLKKLVFDMEKRIKRLRISFSALLLLGVNIGFYLICIILDQREYLVGSGSLIILSISIALTSKSIIYGNIFGQIGLPINESKINICTMLTNLVLNLILIPIYGIIGAATATAVSYILFATYQKVLINKVVAQTDEKQ